MLTDAQIAVMSNVDRIGEAMRRSLPHLPDDAKRVVEAMLQPETLAIIAGTLVLWAGSHFFGIGEIVDVILLVVGGIFLGFAVFEAAGKLYDFANGAINAKTDDDLEQAGKDFARAVVLLGISTIQAILLRGQARPVIARGRPQTHPRLRMPPPPPRGQGLKLSRPSSIPGGSLGETDVYGAIVVARNQSMREQRLTLYHEMVHRLSLIHI